MKRLLLHRMVLLSGCVLMALTGLIGPGQQFSFDQEQFAPQVRTLSTERFTIRQRTAMLRVHHRAAPVCSLPVHGRTVHTKHSPPELGPPSIRSDDRSAAGPG